MRIVNILALLVCGGILVHGLHRVLAKGESLREHWPPMIVAAGYGAAFFAFGFLPRDIGLWVVFLGLAAALPGFGAQIWRGRRR